MTDFVDGGASAPAESAPASAEPVTQTPNPISTEREPSPPEPVKTEPDAKPEAKEPKEAAKPISTREALQKAAEKVNAENSDQTKPVKSEPARAENGKFAAKEGEKPAEAKPDVAEKPAEAQQPAKAAEVAAKPANVAGEAPARFSADAKAAWAQAPDAVRAEVARMEREMTAGLEKYRGAAEKFETVRPHAEWVEKNGGNVKEVFDDYVRLNHMIMINPIGALEEICKSQGFSLRQVVEHLSGQTPDQTATAYDQKIMGLERTISGLQQQLQGVTGTIQEQQNAQTLSHVQDFAAKNPRFDELADAIAAEIKHGYSLQEAYERADRLNPAPASNSNPTPIPAPATAPVAQTDKGQKSITGAPTPGSDPVKRQPSSSIREALVRAAAKAS